MEQDLGIKPMELRDQLSVKESRFLFPFFLFLLLTLGFHLDKLIDGQYSRIVFHDSFDHEFPRHLQTAKLLLKHGLFGWYPSLAGGAPSYAYQFPPYYPVNLLALFLPLWLISSLLTMTWMCLAGYGMYLLLKERLSLSIQTAIAGGVVFAIGCEISGFGVIHVVFSYCFPLFYFLVTQRSQRWQPLLAAGLGLFFLTFFSYPVLTLPFFITLHFLFIFLIEEVKNFDSFKNQLQRWILYWTSYVVSVLPLLYCLFCSRDITARKYAALTTSFLPVFWNSIRVTTSETMMIFLLGGSLLLIAKSQRVRKALLLCTFLVVIAAFFNSSAASFLASTLFSKMDLLHFDFTLPIAFAVTGFLGLHEATLDKKRFKLFLTGGTISLLLMAVSLDTRTLLLNVLVAVGVILFAGKNIKFGLIKNLWWVAMIVVVVIGRGVRTKKFEDIRFNQLLGHSTNLKKGIPDDEPVERIITLFANPAPINLTFNEIADGRSPLLIRTYKEFVRVVVDKQVISKENQDGFDYPYNVSFCQGILFDPSYSRANMDLRLNWPLLASANITRVISPFYLTDLAGRSSSWIELKPKHNHSDYIPGCSLECIPRAMYRFDLKDTFARGYLVNYAKFFDSEDQLLVSLLNQSMESMRDTAFLLKESNPPVLTPTKKPSEKTVHILSYSPDKIAFDVETESPAYLVVSNNFHPRWTATINGISTPIYRTNHTFQSVYIPASGKSKVVFEYKDPLLWRLHWFVPIGLLLIVVLPLIFGRSGKNTD